MIGTYSISISCFIKSLTSPGLFIRVRLMRSLPERYKVDIVVKPGSHQSEYAGLFWILVFDLANSMTLH